MNIRNAIKKYADALKSLRENSDAIELPSMPASAAALTVAALHRHAPETILWILPEQSDMEQAHCNLTTLPGPSDGIAFFPPQETASNSEAYGQRMRVLQQLLSDKPPAIIVTCIQALLTPLPQPDTIQDRTITLELDADINLDKTIAALSAAGYNFEPEVHDRSEASLRGGILDIWPPTELWPVRIELFGPTISSIRYFDPSNQISIEKIAAIEISPATGSNEPDSVDNGKIFPEGYTRHPLLAVWNDPGKINEAANAFLELQDLSPDTFTIKTSPITSAANATVIINPDHTVKLPPYMPKFMPIKYSAANNPELSIINAAEQNRRRLIENIAPNISRRFHLALFCNTEGSLQHVIENIFQPRIKTSAIHPSVGTLSDGFECAALKLTVVAEADLYGQRRTLSRRYDPYNTLKKQQKHSGARISDFSDMQEGDLVVHVEHGIGRFIGLQRLEFNGEEQEVIAVEYADEARLYIPLSHAHMLSRYIGLSSRKAHIHKLGGKRWSRDKDAAKKAVMDFAADLLEVQAARNLLHGHAFPEDPPIQHEFAAAFPFRETEDQITVIEDIKNDMQSTRPMDRLVCGDAGYGKTEVAMRAAFRAVQDGRQVAMLVPTTILAQQHYHTFTERMAGFAINIEVLSRFRTPAQRRKIIEDLKNGKIDIIIGTHALISPEVGFTNLGLVIIDEEQRFGVRHKEHLKHMKKLVDVLTLSATPIPRTLYMSMTGARDMSLLQTPPRERTAIETVIATASDEIIRKAVMRELRRNGQIYYLHNRVLTIYRLRDKLIKLLPEARICVAHGQMKTSELSHVMENFANGNFDLLLCTTIIESGMDIPRANTILIDRADRFGLADLYQLRGRVGRSSRKAYAYLLLPPHGRIDSDARERIRAIRQHSGLGAGFNLAVRDMEIRGAGNILGAAQSGHIAAVGFAIYCQMLKRSIANLKGEKPPPLIETEVRLDFITLTPPPSPQPDTATACIPFNYIAEERARVAIYRRIAEATDTEELDALSDELADRFGPLPEEAQRVLKIATIRIAAAHLQLQSVEVRDNKIILRRDNKYTHSGHRFPTLAATAPDEKLTELLNHINEKSYPTNSDFLTPSV